MGHKRARFIKEIHVSEHDLLVGDYRRSHRAFDYVLDFGFVLRTQKDRQVMGRLSYAA
jgi:hypothetical protein